MSEYAVLVLNRNWQAVRVARVRRAITMLFVGAARALDHEYESYDFVSWLGVGQRAGQDAVLRTFTRRIRVPNIVVLNRYSVVPKGCLRFSRSNVYARDKHTCQYCARRLPRSQLNLDHVVPRASGGRTSWHNIVCCCIRCNLRKGSRTPTQAGMRLLRKPYAPRWSPIVGIGPGVLHREWLPFLRPADVELYAPQIKLAG